jgi:hypothetical protein
VRAAEVLSECSSTLAVGMKAFEDNVVAIKARMVEAQKEGMDNLAAPNLDEKSSNRTKKPKRGVDFNDFKWFLSAMALVASFYNSLGF